MSDRTEKYDKILLPEGWYDQTTCGLERIDLEGGIIDTLDQKSLYVVITDCHDLDWLMGFYSRESWSEDERKEWLKFPAQMPYSERQLPNICRTMYRLRDFAEMVAFDVREGSFYLRMPRYGLSLEELSKATERKRG
ncbi:MAG: hypothetical protein WCV90_07585 [Candidatus Woesearchaeota archaeon]|jgi:hypothetical protein